MTLEQQIMRAMNPNQQITALPNDLSFPTLAVQGGENLDAIESLSDITYTLSETSEKAEVSLMNKNIDKAKETIDKEVAANALNNKTMSFLKGQIKVIEAQASSLNYPVIDLHTKIGNVKSATNQLDEQVKYRTGTLTDNLSKFQINVGKMLSVTTEVPSWNKRIDEIQVKIRQVINL